MHARHPKTATRGHARFHTAALGIVFVLLGVVASGPRERSPVQPVHRLNEVAPSGIFETASQKMP